MLFGHLPWRQRGAHRTGGHLPLAARLEGACGLRASRSRSCRLPRAPARLPGRGGLLRTPAPASGAAQTRPPVEGKRMCGAPSPRTGAVAPRGVRKTVVRIGQPVRGPFDFKPLAAGASMALKLTEKHLSIKACQWSACCVRCVRVGRAAEPGPVRAPCRERRPPEILFGTGRAWRAFRGTLRSALQARGSSPVRVEPRPISLPRRAGRQRLARARAGAPGAAAQDRPGERAGPNADLPAEGTRATVRQAGSLIPLQCTARHGHCLFNQS
jgi:hypothetical protein